MSDIKVGVIVGSLRKKSFSKQVAENLARMFPANYQVNFIDLSQLEMYNQDFDDENRVPESYKKFRQEIAAQDAFLFVTPEYNRSVPAVLKNALDVASRPFGQNQWNGKPAAIISNSPGNLSAFGANHHLRQSLVFLNMPMLLQPEVYLAHVNTFLNEDGKVNNPDTEKFFQTIVDSFVAWIEQLRK